MLGLKVEEPEESSPPKAKAVRSSAAKKGGKKERPELPDSVEELNRLTGGLRPFARPVVRAYSDLMEFVSDEALDDDERQMGTETVAALMWYYGLTHPAVFGLLFIGGTLGRRAPKIAKKMQARKAARLGGGMPQLRAVSPAAQAPVAGQS